MNDERMLVIGIDPDTKATGIAAVQYFNGGFQVVGVGLARAKGRKAADRRVEMIDSLWHSLAPEGLRLPYPATAVVVEWQHIRPFSEKRPNDILNLTGVAGMCVATAVTILDPKYTFTPIPSEWKKQVPKHIHQARILSRLHLTRELRYENSDLGNAIFIPGAENLPPSMRTHVIDAIGLACWACTPLGPIYDARLEAEIKANK